MSVLRRNVPYLTQQCLAALSNTGLFGRFVVVVTLLGYALSFWPAAVTALSVTPGYLLPPHLWLWTALTHCFLEVHLWEVCVDILTVALCSKLLEPLWGGHEMLLFFLLVNVLVAVLSGVFYLLLYMCTGNADLLFAVHIHGLAGYVAACSVAVKQIMPDHVLVRKPLKLTNRNVPLILVLLSMLLYVVGALEGSYATMFTLGFVISWTYLRFYQPHSNGTRGDMATEFAFSQFFPNVLQPPVSLVCNVVYACLLRLRCCRKPVKKYDVGAPSSITITLPGVDAQDAERRRQIALKALNDRLQRVESPTAWPSLDEEAVEEAKSPLIPAPTHVPLPPSPQPPDSGPAADAAASSSSSSPSSVEIV